MERQNILAELLLDASFQAWVLSDGKEYNGYWQKWIKDHPDQREVLDIAKMALLKLKEEKYMLPEERKYKLRQRLVKLVQTEYAAEPDITNSFVGKKLWATWFRIAVAVVILFAISWIVYFYKSNRPQQMQYRTAYGEIKTIVLPDSSQVTLNGNSSIRYSYRQSEESLREVWLEGEGFFDVRHVHIQANESAMQAVKFIVHTDNLSINVLGTRFNVKNRHEKTQVVLEKGSIQLDIVERRDSLLMRPDELVEVKKGERLINQKTVEAGDYIAWKEGIINFEEATYDEISSILKDNYGLVLYFANKQDAEKINLRGSFPTQNIDILLEAIANVTHTTMKKKGKTILYQ